MSWSIFAYPAYTNKQMETDNDLKNAALVGFNDQAEGAILGGREGSIWGAMFRESGHDEPTCNDCQNNDPRQWGGAPAEHLKECATCSDQAESTHDNEPFWRFNNALLNSDIMQCAEITNSDTKKDWRTPHAFPFGPNNGAINTDIRQCDRMGRRWLNFQACKTSSSSTYGPEPSFADCLTPAIGDFGDGTISFLENTNLYVPGRGPNNYFRAEYSGVGKHVLQFKKSPTFTSTTVCQKKFVGTQYDDNGFSNIRCEVDSQGNHPIAQDMCFCESAWEDLLTGGLWYTPNSTREDRRSNQKWYDASAPFSYGVGCTPTSFPDAPTLKVNGIDTDSFRIFWNYSDYMKGGRHKDYNTESTLINSEMVSEKHLEIEISSVSSSAGFSNLIRIEGLSFWCYNPAIDNEEGVYDPYTTKNEKLRNLGYKYIATVCMCGGSIMIPSRFVGSGRRELTNMMDLPPLPPLPSLMSTPHNDPTLKYSSSPTTEGLLVSSISQQLQTLQKENEMQRRRLHVVERQKEDMIRTMEEMKAVSIPSSSSVRVAKQMTLERTMEQLDLMSNEFQSSSIQHFVTHIKSIVGGLHEQLVETNKELKDVKATNAVLQVCLQVALRRSMGDVEEEEEEEEEENLQGERDRDDASDCHEADGGDDDSCGGGGGDDDSREGGGGGGGGEEKKKEGEGEEKKEEEEDEDEEKEKVLDTL